MEELIPCLERDQGGTQAAGVQGRPLFPHTRSALLQLNSENIERILDRNEEIERLRTASEYFETVNPTTLPRASSNGPPLLPSETGTSACMRRNPLLRSNRIALTTPLVMVTCNISFIGLPTA